MQPCTKCFKRTGNWQPTNRIDSKTGARIWRCRNHGKNDAHYQAEEPAQGLTIPPNILYLDIETAMMKVWVYDLFSEQNTHISPDMIDKARFVINWAAAWVKPDYTMGKMFSAAVTTSEVKRQDDKRILRPLFDLMNEADYICGHNSKGFDVKILKWRFLKHGWGYPHEAKQKDTLTSARQTKPESRSLDYMMGELLGQGKRHELTREEWKEIAEHGTPALLNKSNRYCRRDVKIGVGLLKILVQAEEQAGKVIFK